MKEFRYIVAAVLAVSFSFSVPHQSLGAGIVAVPPADPCALVAQSDAGQVMHGDARPAVTRKIYAGKLCQYRSSDNTMNVFVQNVNPGVMHILPKMGATAVPNIGDAALLFRNSVYIKKGSNVVQVSLYPSSLAKGTSKSDLLALATLVASRM